MKVKNTIWSNENLAEEIEYIGKQEEYTELSEDEKTNLAYEHINMGLEDERVNLDIQLSGAILCIASLGLWNGRKQGYKVIKSGNIKDILYSDCDLASWYSNGHNIKAKLSHHDGTNYIEYREIKNEENIDALLNDIYNGKTISRQRLNYYTKSILPEVKKVYGW